MHAEFISSLRQHLEVAYPKERGRLSRFAKAAETTQPTVSLVLSGERSPPKGGEEKWADALGLKDHQRSRFIGLYRAAKASFQTSAAPALADFAERAERAERLVVVLGRRLIKRGVKLDKETVELIETLGQRLGL